MSSTVSGGEYMIKAGASNPASKVPLGVWEKCSSCQQLIYRKKLIDNDYICPQCGKYFYLDAEKRASMLTDSFERIDENILPEDPLKFTDSKPYKDKLKE